MTEIREIMAARREALGVTYPQLARSLDTSETQVNRWCTKSDPPARMLRPIARALSFSVAELVGDVPVGLDLSGLWHALWSTSRDGLSTLNSHTLHARHFGEFVYLDAEGDYAWRADFRLDGSALTGSYRAVDEGRNERGAMSLTLNHHGSSAAIGHWSGSWADGINGVGYGVITRDEQRRHRLMKLLLDQPTSMITEWPREDQG